MTELDAPTTTHVAADSIRVARLPRPGTAAGAAASAEPAPGPAAAVEIAEAPSIIAPPALGDPPALVIVVEAARPARIKAGVALALAMVALLWVLIDSGTIGASSGTRKVPVRHGPAQPRAGTAAAVRAAAIAQAKRDRGTDAELQDTIPAPIPAPTSGR
jgi:hypothetical protein